MNELSIGRKGPLLWLAGRSRRFWIAAIVTSVVLPVAVVASLWFWPWGLTSINARRIVAGMTQSQVEDILGASNPGLFDLRRKRQAMWDATPMFGLQYISMTIQYDADGNVASTVRLYEARSVPPWARWLWPQLPQWWY